MKKLLFFTLIVYTAYFAHQKYLTNAETREEKKTGTPTAAPAAAPTTYIIVYGRKSCGNTTRMMRELDQAGVGYAFRDIDNRSYADNLHQQMRKTGQNANSYALPVIEIAGKIYINPFAAEVLKNYRSAKG